MTSNVGSKRILQIVKDRESNERKSESEEVKVIDGTNSEKKSMEPPNPEDVLKKLQSSPKAMALMMEAAGDPEIMDAMQTAIGGSPADLMKVAQKNEKVSDFLTRLWGALEMDPSPNGSSEKKKSKKSKKKKSGLESVRSGVESTLEEWSNSASTSGNEFTSGLVNQLKSFMSDDDESTDDDEDETMITIASTEANDKAAKEYTELCEVVKEELEDVIKPEVLNRVDEIIVFAPLGESDLVSIAQLIVNETAKRAKRERNVDINIGPLLLKEIVYDGSSSAAQFGARPMRRAVQRYFEDTVSDAIIRGFVKELDNVTVELSDDYDSVKITRDSDGESLLSPVEDGNGGIGSTVSNFQRTGNAENELETQTK